MVREKIVKWPKIASNEAPSARFARTPHVPAPYLPVRLTFTLTVRCFGSLLVITSTP